MQLCLECGHVAGHSATCDHEAASADAAAATRDAMARAREVLAAAPASPREGVMAAWRMVRDLEHHSAQSLEAFDQKREHRDLVSGLGKRRAELVAALEPGEGDRLIAFLERQRQIVELRFELSMRKREAAEFDLSALGSLTLLPIKELGDATKVTAEVEERLRESASDDGEVKAWGLGNLRPLVGGREPTTIPPELMPAKGLTVRLGSLVGVGGAGQRDTAVGKFRRLGARFKERLYLLGTNILLLARVSRLARAEDAWAKHLREAGDPEVGAEAHRDAIAWLLGSDVEPEQGIVAGVDRLVASSPASERATLLSFEALSTDDWDALARAYFLEMNADVDAPPDAKLSFENVARVLLGRKRDAASRLKTARRRGEEVRAEWNKRWPDNPLG